MRLAAILVVVVIVVAATLAAQGPMAELTRWAVETQRAFQNEMAAAVRALRGGDPGAWLALMAAAGAYGFVHAVGPGHGKYLIGGVGLGSAVSAPRLLVIAVLSSLAQAIWAIVLVYGGFFLLEVSARQVTTLTEAYLAPASYLAVGAIGLLLAVRGLRGLRHGLGRTEIDAGHDHHHDECGCHAHGPRPEDVAKLTSLRDVAVLIGSIAIRPCTGAVFLLVIAWQMGILGAGAAAVVTMGVGTGLLTGLVAVSSTAARGLAYAYSGTTGIMPVAAPSLQLASGLLIVWFSAALLSIATA